MICTTEEVLSQDIPLWTRGHKLQNQLLCQYSFFNVPKFSLTQCCVEMRPEATVKINKETLARKFY